jgi:intein/homing endonuclease
MTERRGLREAKTCRVCGFHPLQGILSLGELYVSNFVDEPEQREQEKYPLDLVLCNKQAGGCGLLQLRHTVSNEILYRNYWYRSGTNQTMTDELNDICRAARSLVNLGTGDMVIDIGSNDGTLLRAFGEGVGRVGFEPARNLIPVAELNATKIINDFFNFEAFDREFPGRRAKVITAIAMFYDLDDPNRFVGDVARCLDPEGVFIIQMSYLPLMLSQNAFDNICVKPDTVILGDNKPIKDVSTGDYAIGRSNRLVRVLAKMERPYDGEMVRIKPAYLEPITLTPEHPVLAVKKEHVRFDCGQLKPRAYGYAPEWIPAKRIKRGDWVVMPKVEEHDLPPSIDLHQFNQLTSKGYRGGLRSLPLDPETAWMLGLYVAEGHVGGHKDNPYLEFTLNRREEKIVERLDALFASLGYKTLHLTTRPEVKSIGVRVVCAALCRAFTEWFGKGAIHKHVPDFLLFAPSHIKTAFLRGLFEGDGYIQNNKVHFHTSSKTLAFQVQLMTASLGGMLGISYVKPYRREIRGGAVISRDSWQLRGSSKALARIFGYQHRGPEIPHVVLKESYILVPVRSVSLEHYVGIVHNIETEDNSYLVSNAVVHNCHEHLEYYSLLSLEYLLNRHNLEVFDVELNDVNGGSFRIFIRHRDAGRTLQVPAGAAERVAQRRADEERLGLNDRAVYGAFVERVLALKEQTVRFVRDAHVADKKVYIYGASTKGNTLLQFYGLDSSLVPFAAERNQDKWGKKTVGSLIPIISEEQARLDRPDYFLVLPWHFLKEFKERERKFLEGGGRFIVPLPEFRIVGP